MVYPILNKLNDINIIILFSTKKNIINIPILIILITKDKKMQAVKLNNSPNLKPIGRKRNKKISDKNINSCKSISSFFLFALSINIMLKLLKANFHPNIYCILNINKF